MKKLKKILILALSIALPFGVMALCAAAADTDPVYFDDVVLCVGADETQRNLTWYSTESEAGSVDFAPAGETEEFPSEYTTVNATVTAAIVKTGYYINRVVISGLEADTQYVYRLRVGAEVSRTYTFKTPKADEFSFFAAGDVQVKDAAGEGRWIDSLNKLAANFGDTNLLISVGDQINSYGDEIGTMTQENHWSNFLVDELANFTFSPTAGPAHDVASGDSKFASYGERFYLPNLSDKYGVTKSVANYWYVYNNTLFMTLNSNGSSAHHKQFIIEAMAANPDVMWKVVTIHYPIYSAGSTGAHGNPENQYYDYVTRTRRDELAPIFTDLGIDVVLSGHDHLYVRSKLMDGLNISDDVVVNNTVTDPNGVLYVEAGLSGGYNPTVQNFNHADYFYADKISTTTRKSITVFRVTENSLTLESYYINTDTPELFDTFTINKTKADDAYVEEPINAPTATDTVSFLIYDASGKIVETGYEGTITVDGVEYKGYINYTTAFSKVPDGGKIVMVGDYETGAPASSYLSFSKSVTLDLNGHTFSSSYSTTATGASLSAVLVPATASGKLFTITGSGAIKTATTFALANSGGYSNILVNPGEGNTISFEAIAGYKCNSSGVASENVTFQKNHAIFRVGHASGVLGATLTVNGTVSYRNVNSRGSFVGAYSGANVVINNATINADIIGWDNEASLFRNFTVDSTVARKSAVFTFTNSTVNSPKGVFIRFWDEGGIGDASIATAPKLIIDNCQLNFDGKCENRWNDFFVTTDMYADIRVSNSNIVTDAQYPFYAKLTGKMPNSTLRLADTNIDVTAYTASAQALVYGGLTAVIEGGKLTLGEDDDIFQNGFAWTTEDTHDSENGALPAYADPANENKDYYVGGYGRVLKAGTVYNKQITAGGVSGTHSTGADSFAFDEGTKGVDNGNGTYTVTIVDPALLGPQATKVKAFSVTDADGNEIGQYVKFAEAVANTPTNGKITMIASYEEGKVFAQIEIPANKSITLDLNGRTFSVSYAIDKLDESGKLYQKLLIKGTLNVIGSGTIKSATSFFLVQNGGNLVVDPGEGNTMNFEVITTYNIATGEPSTSQIPGGEFVKLGESTGYGDKRPTATVKGNISYTNSNGKSGLGLFGIRSGTRLYIEDANINCVLIGNDAEVIYINGSSTYDAAQYIAPEATIKNSKIISPVGRLFYNGQTAITEYSDAATLIIENSFVDLRGEVPVSSWGYGSIHVEGNAMTKIVMTGSKMYTESLFFRNGTQSDVTPNVTIEVYDSLISLRSDGDTSSDRKNFLFGVVTAIIDDSVLAVESNAYEVNGRTFRYTHGWCSADVAKEKGYTDPGYFDTLGMGVLLKSGTVLVINSKGNGSYNGFSTSTGAGVFSTAYSGYVVEAGSTLSKNAYAYLDGVLTRVPYYVNANTIHTLITFHNATTGSYTVGDGTVYKADGTTGGSFGTSITGLNFGTAIAPRKGRYTVCESADGNKYITHQHNNNGSTDPYTSIKFSDGSWKNGDDKTVSTYSNPLSSAKFYSFEVDMASAALRHSTGEISIGFLFRGANVGATAENVEYLYVTHATAANGNSTWKIGDKTLNSTALPGEWQHIQVILEAPIGDDGKVVATNDNKVTFNAYLYLDGELAISTTFTMANSYASLDRVAIAEVRFRFPAYVADTVGATAVDNFMSCSYPVSYQDDLNSVVTKGYKLPETFPVVKVDGESFNDVDAAFRKLVSLVNEGKAPVFEYVMDVSSVEFDPTKYGALLGSKYIFKTGGKTLKLKSGVGYTLLQNGDETLVIPSAYSIVDNPENTDFEVGTVGAYSAGAGVIGGSLGGIDTSRLAERYGKYTIVGDVDGNKYLTHVQNGVGKTTDQPFVNFSYSPGGSQSAGYAHPLDEERFYSIEIDMASAELRHSQGNFSFGLLFRGGATRSDGFKERIASYVYVNLSTDANGNSVWKIGSKTVASASSAAGVWQHVQIIIEAPVRQYNEGTDYYTAFFDTTDVAGFTFHLYLDGEYAGSATLAEASSTLAGQLANNPDDKKNYDSLKNVALTDVRLYMPEYKSSVTYSDGSTAMDNIVMKRYPITYTAGLTSGEDILDSVVNRNYTTPANIPVVEVDGEGFNDIDAAFRKLVSLAKDGYVPTLEYKMDISSITFDPSKYGVADKATFKFVTGGKGVTVAAVSGYEAVQNDDGSYTVQPAEKLVTVTWLDRNGDEIATQQVVEGQYVPLYVIENPYVIEESYYDVVYNAWAIDGVYVLGDSILADRDLTLKSAATLRAKVQILFNIELNDNIGLQFYVPQGIKNDATISNVSVGVNTGGSTSVVGTATVDDVVYDRYSTQYITYSAFTTNYYCNVTYTVSYGGYEYNLTYRSKISPLEYVTIILNGNFDSLTKTHVANLLRFANEFNRIYNKGSYNADVNSVYETYKSLCTAYETDLLAPSDITYGGLETYLDSFFVKVSSGRAQYSLEFKDGVTGEDGVTRYVTGVSIKKYGLSGVKENTYISVDGGGVYGSTTATVLIDGKEVTYYTEYSTMNLRYHSFFGPLDITLTLSDGSSVSGKYDLNTWYNSVRFADDAEKAMWGDFFKALKELGDSHKAYRYGIE